MSFDFDSPFGREQSEQGDDQQRRRQGSCAACTPDPSAPRCRGARGPCQGLGGRLGTWGAGLAARAHGRSSLMAGPLGGWGLSGARCPAAAVVQRPGCEWGWVCGPRSSLRCSACGLVGRARTPGQSPPSLLSPVSSEEDVIVSGIAGNREAQRGLQPRVVLAAVQADRARGRAAVRELTLARGPARSVTGACDSLPEQRWSQPSRLQPLGAARLRWAGPRGGRPLARSSPLPCPIRQSRREPGSLIL